MPNHKPFVQTFRRRVTKSVEWITLLVTVIMVASLLIGVFFRYVLRDSLSWTDEVALLAFAWMVFLSAALDVEDDSHVRVGLVLDKLPVRLRWVMIEAIWLVMAAFGAFTAWVGTRFTLFTASQLSPALRYPMWLLTSALDVAGVLIAVYALLNVKSFAAYFLSTGEDAHD